MLAPIISALGGIAFLISAFFIVQDRRDAEENIEGKYTLFPIPCRAPNVALTAT
jgi:hypothetical protein